MQLDIFEHSRDTMLRNDALQALEQHDAGAAQAAWLALAEAYPDDTALPDLALLVEAIAPATTPPPDSPFSDPAALQQAWLALQDRVSPAAQRLFGTAGAARWAAPLWCQIARRAAALTYAGSGQEHREEHAAPAWLHGRDWAAAAEAVWRIPSWRRIPAPLGWMAQARFHLQGLDASWPLLAELAWLAPARLQALMQALADPALDKLRQRFARDFDGAGTDDDLAWFPAWLLVHKPGLAALLGPAQPGQHRPPEQGLRLLLDLLHLEREGRHAELIERRKTLRELHAGLYAAYMATR